MSFSFSALLMLTPRFQAISQLDFKVDDGIASLNIMVSQLSDEFRDTYSDATVRRKVNEIESEVTKLESELLRWASVGLHNLDVLTCFISLQKKVNLPDSLFHSY